MFVLQFAQKAKKISLLSLLTCETHRTEAHMATLHISRLSISKQAERLGQNSGRINILFLTMMHIFNALSIFAPGLVHFAFTPRLLRTHSGSNPTFFGGVEFTCLLRYLIRIGKMLRSHLKDNSDYPK